MIVKRRALLATASVLTLLRGVRVLRAAEPIHIGALFPLTGNSAGAGQECREAIEVGQEIVNNAHPELAPLPLAATGGLPNLGGAPIETIFVDHRGDPALAQTETLRLITQNHVPALIGSYQSNTALTATAVAERYGVPFVVSDSVAANITQRGFKWTFRVTPIAPNFAETYMRFIQQMKQGGKSIDKVAIVAENTDYGTSVGDAIEAAAKSAGIPVATRVRYSANSPDMSSEVLTLKNADPAVVLFVSYTSDAILYMKTMKSLNWLPPMIIGDSAGFSDPSFVNSVGDLAQGVLNRSAWSPGKAGGVTQKINALFKAKTGRDMSDASGRVMQAFFVLADAINQAGAAVPGKIQAALQATDLKPDQLIVGYSGVKFDASGQNSEGATYITQLDDKSYVTVWPADAAAAALVWPMRGWRA
ncbi:MAG TPA: ABC transporter substrate-binding protein [Acetobacteraceae bacterium]